MYRFKQRVSKANAYPYDSGSRFCRWIEAGTVVAKLPAFGLGVKPEDVEKLPDPHDWEKPKTPAELLAQCGALDEWWRAGYVLWADGGGRIIKQRLDQLVDAAVGLDMTDPPETKRLNQRGVRVALNRLRQWAAESCREPEPEIKAAVSAATETSLDARALALFIEDPSRKKKELAKMLGLKATQSLAPTRCPKLAAAMRAYRAKDPGRHLPRGWKDAEGNLEAYHGE